MRIKSSRIDNSSITQTSQEIYFELRKKLEQYHKVDAQKLAHYLYSEKRMTTEAIGRILGMSRQAVEQKYFPREASK